MLHEKILKNSGHLQLELQWFQEVLKTRSLLNAGKTDTYSDVFEIPLPKFPQNDSEYSAFLTEHNLNFAERFLLVLGLVPHIKPELLDVFFQQNESIRQVFTEFGGKKGKSHTGFLPTAETFLFILSAGDLSRRFQLLGLFEPEHFFAKNQVLSLDEVEHGEPFLNGGIQVSREFIELFTTGTVSRPVFSADFPAKILETAMDWDDLVLPNKTVGQIMEIETWLEHHPALMHDWGMSKKVKPGYRAMFYGPSGTGKSLTAALLGKRTGKDVYRVDLSRVVSKYIGETEKNLSKIFDRAENRGWILFFDEADALFGKRTEVKDSHDRFANQEISYLLQRIEDFNGLVILASNLKNNLDEAFTRRFQSMIYFPVPRAVERLQLWKTGFSSACKLDRDINLEEISESFELTGANIINIVQFASLRTLKRGNDTIVLKDLLDGIKKELQKSGRSI